MGDNYSKKPDEEKQDRKIQENNDSVSGEESTATENDALKRSDDDKTNPFIKFFRNWGAVLSVCGVLCLIIAMGVIAFAFGGDIYDKVAMLWILVVLAELAYYIIVNRSRKTLIVLIATAMLVVGCIVLYGFEVGGILP